MRQEMLDERWLFIVIGVLLAYQETNEILYLIR